MKDLYQFKWGISKTAVCFAMLLFCMILQGTPVFAQDDASSGDDEFTLEEIRVTGTRIRTSGMDTPTPVTVVVPDEISISSPATVIEGLAELPQFYGSNTTQNTNGFFQSSGAGTLNLRGLQGKRTLQLLDGRRVVPSTIFGGPDVNLFPSLLLRSVETVTGGASAAYGTNAVAGVVNFILNTDYEGIKGNVQYGITERGHNKNYNIQLAGGYQFTDQTRVLVSVEKGAQDPIWGEDLLDYEWYNSNGLIASSAEGKGESRDNPANIVVPRLYSTTASINGILYKSQYGSPWYTFDESGNAVPWVASDGACGGGMCSTTNADGSAMDSNIYSSTQITPKSDRENFFGYIEHDFSHKLKVFGQGMYGKTSWTNRALPASFPQWFAPFTIYRENPYLPQEIQDLMDNNVNADGDPAPLSSVTMSRVGGLADLGLTMTKQETKTISLTTGFEYNVGSGFFDDWQLNGYVQYGKTDVNAIIINGTRVDRIFLAADVVTDPLTGQPACNVTVTTRDTENPIYQDCVPINLFGAGQASQEAIDWVVGFEPGVQMNANGFLDGVNTLDYSYVSSGDKRRVIEIEQTVLELSADGEIYKGWGSGPIRMAAGYNYREEKFTQATEVGPGGNVNADPFYYPVMANDASLGIRGVPTSISGNTVSMQFSKTPFAKGDQNVHEVFTELLVPILSDMPAVKQLNFNGAARWAKYNGLDPVWSWKGGLDWSPTSELRFRSTLSRDVRAATIGEKYDRTGGAGSVNDYLALDSSGNPLTYSVTTFSNGSPDIKPERATTGTVGMVYMPDWLKGFSFSMDWYSVDIKDNINQVSSTDVTTGCYQDGIQKYCDMITRGGDPLTDDGTPSGNPIYDANGNQETKITIVGQPYINKDSVKAVGVDFELDYRTPVKWFGGEESFLIRLLGSYVTENSSTVDGVKVETADITYPEWVGTLSATYMRGPLKFTLQNRYTGETLKNRNWNFNGTSTQWDVADNTYDATILTDMNVSYAIDTNNGKYNVSLNVNNVFDKDPEQYFTGTASSFWGTGPGLGVAGDLRGRRYTLGVTFEFK